MHTFDINRMQNSLAKRISPSLPSKSLHESSLQTEPVLSALLLVHYPLCGAQSPPRNALLANFDCEFYFYVIGLSCRIRAKCNIYAKKVRKIGNTFLYQTNFFYFITD